MNFFSGNGALLLEMKPMRMRRLLQITFFIFLFSAGKLSAQTCCFTFQSTPIASPMCAGVTLAFDANCSTGASSYNWDFGAGAFPQTSTSVNPLVNFPLCGNYHVTLQINGTGPTCGQFIDIWCEPTACFTTTPTQACLGVPTQFDASCSTAGSGFLNYLWDFCDGDSSTAGANVTHTYPGAGCYCATLVVTNNHGCSDFLSIPSNYCVTDPPSFTITSGLATSCALGLQVDFCTGAIVGGTPPFSFAWNFPGGAPLTSTDSCPQNITYNVGGSWNVSCTVTDANGCSNIVQMNNYVNIANNATTIYQTDDTVCVGQTVDVSTTPASSYTWSISPGVGVSPSANQTTATVTYTFSATGTYTITLNSIVNGCPVSDVTTVVVMPQPVANFTIAGNVPTCMPPQLITFNNTTVGGPWTYFWDFGDGTNSTLQNPPPHNYTTCGQFSISLTVTGVGGCSNTKTLLGVVNINCPDACYTVDSLPLNGQYCAPWTLAFDATCSTGSPTQYLWCVQLQGGPACVPQNLGATPNITFPTAGCYNITLQIINASGCSASVTNDFTGIPFCIGIHIDTCFTANPIETCAPVPVLFTNCSSSGVGIPPVYPPCTSWYWNFGDGGTSTNESPQHLYQDTGLFTIMLVAQNCGCYDTTIWVDMIHVTPPIPVINYTIPCDSPNIVHFVGTNSIGADTYLWSFPGGVPSTSTSANVTVTYPMPNPNASHPVQLLICNLSSNCCDSTSVTVFLRQLAAIATLDTVVCYPQTSAITNTSIGGGNAYVWKVYDACNNNVQLFTSQLQSYDQAGTSGALPWPGPGMYHVLLRVISLTGCEDTLEWDVEVHGLDPGFWGAPNSGCAPFNVTFHDTTNANCISNPVTYVLDFGDGTAPSPPTPVGNPIVHTYNTNGSFTVTQTVTDQFGCSNTDSSIAYVNAQTPTLGFYAPDTTICLGTPCCFFNTSTGINLTYLWDFGDGDTSTLAFPCHDYLAPGVYTVTLSAADTNACTASMTILNYIIVGDLDIDFTVDNDSTNCPQLISTFSVIPPPVNGCVKYDWDFGDGSHAFNNDSPFHIYAFAGLFTVSLIATDTCLGCTDTIIKPDYIYVGGPFSNPSADPDTACEPQLVCFDLNPTNSVSFLWNFDDSSPLVVGTSTICHLYTTEGIYYPSCQLSDGAGCTYFRIVDTIMIVKVHPGFISSTHDLCSNGFVTFTDTSNAVGGIVSWCWNFGDGIGCQSTLQNPTHNYTTFGDFVVTLIATANGACADSATDTIHVTPSPTAIPLPPPTGLCLGQPIQFTGDTVGSSSVCSVHWDFGDLSITTDTSNILNPIYTYNAPGAYDITFIVYGCNGCNDTAVTSIIINPLPVADAGPDVTICFQDSTDLPATGGVTFSWLPNTNIINGNTSTPTVFPPVTTTYTVTVTDVNGCTAVDSVVVTITTPPVASVTATDTICPGGSYSFTASGGIDYVWQPGNDSTATITVSPAVTTTYTVTAYDGECFDDTTVVLYVFIPPTADAGPDQEYCFGDSTQLNGSGGITYSWTPNVGLSDPNISNPMANPTITTTYYLNITDANSCPGNDSMILTVHPLPPVDAGQNKKICFGSCTQLTATGALTYSWTPPATLMNDSIYNPIACPTDTTTYYVTGVDVFGCWASDSVVVSVLFPFTVVYPNDTCICLNESAQLCAISSTQSTYFWTPAFGLSSTWSACPVATPTATTTYTIIVSDSLACFADTGNVVICIYPLPVVIAGPDVSILAGTNTDLSSYNVSNPGTGTYQWSPDSTLSCYGCEDPTASPLQTTVYVVELTDLHGCKDEDTTIVKVFCNDNALFIPNAFTPNNDGRNDELKLAGRGISKLNYLRIFNRWGQLVYESTDFTESWDGTFNGKLCEPEVFDYLLEAVCSTGETIRKQGNITLIR